MRQVTERGNDHPFVYQWIESVNEQSKFKWMDIITLYDLIYWCLLQFSEIPLNAIAWQLQETHVNKFAIHDFKTSEAIFWWDNHLLSEK